MAVVAVAVVVAVVAIVVAVVGSQLFLPLWTLRLVALWFGLS